MLKPTIHLNGTSREALLEGYAHAGSAVSRAIEALQDSTPNARDYYPQGEHAFAEAVQEHRARIQALREVYNQLSDLVAHVTEDQR